MSLYSNVYWTKRVLVVLVLLVFICGGIRLFQLVSTSLTRRDIQSSGYKPERGFGNLNKIVLRSIETGEFKPTEFRISTTKGNLDVDNLYPSESEPNPLANVYRIIEQPINLSTTENPLNIGRKLGFNQPPQEITSTVRRWNDSNRELEIDGQYTTVIYSNNKLKKANKAPESGIFPTNEQGQLQIMFTKVLSELEIKTSFMGYTYSGEYLNYDSDADKFIPTAGTNGSFFRVAAKRIYPNLVKINETASTRATYPTYTVSNNYFIIPNLPQYKNINDFNPSTDIVELRIFNWPINQDTSPNNPNVQTYSIKTPRQAYLELSEGKGSLVSITELPTKRPVEIAEIKESKLVDILSVRLDMYEDTFYTKYIQPVYSFICEVNHSGKKYQLVYYVHAITEDNYS